MRRVAVVRTSFPMSGQNPDIHSPKGCGLGGYVASKSESIKFSWGYDGVVRAP